MKIFEPLELLFVGITNFFYNFGIFIYEIFVFGKYKWWWKIKYHFFSKYIFYRTRDLVLGESKSSKYPQDNFIYGETPCITIKTILGNAGIKQNNTFIDLGCGRGATVFYAHYLYNLKAHGYELLPTFIRKARAIKTDMDTEGVKFFQKDILKADISNADVIYIAGTTFDDDFIKKMNDKLIQAKPGAVVVTLSYAIPEKYFNLFREQNLHFTWGKTHVYYQRRRETPKTGKKIKKIRQNKEKQAV